MIQKPESVAPNETMHAAKKRSPEEIAVPPEEEEPEEAGLEEEGEDPLGGERRPEDVADEPRVAGPVRPELELHRDPRRDADGERDGEDLQPEVRHPAGRGRPRSSSAPPR